MNDQNHDSRNERKLPAHRARVRKDRGQVLVIGLFVIVGLSMVSISVANIGIMVAEKISVQDATDAAAYSAATLEARYFNLAAYVNRAVVANYNAMAFNTSIWSLVDATDHGLAAIIVYLYLIAGAIQFIPLAQSAASGIDRFAGGLDNSVHRGMHQLNYFLTRYLGQHEGGEDVGNVIEVYNTDILTTYNGFLYAAVQSSRYAVAARVAQEMDSEVLTTSTIGLAAETISAQELINAVDWVIREPENLNSTMETLNKAFDRSTGEDLDENVETIQADRDLWCTFLGIGCPDPSEREEREKAEKARENFSMIPAIAEASLDRFSAGRNRAGQINLIRSPSLGTIGSSLLPN